MKERRHGLINARMYLPEHPFPQIHRELPEAHFHPSVLGHRSDLGHPGHRALPALSCTLSRISDNNILLHSKVNYCYIRTYVRTYDYRVIIC